MPIVLEKVHYIYGEGSPFAQVALDDIDITLDDGMFIGLVGHTGSGKSTLVQHLNGLIRPTAGRVLVDGEDIWADKANRRTLRQRIGMVFQYPEHQLFEETIYKDIAFGPKNLGIKGDELDARVRLAMAQVGLPESLLEQSPFDLSGGQKRRVAIAGVLAMQPKTLILDEPTAGLDPRGREEILSLVWDWHGKGHSIIMVTHSMEDIARMAQRVIVIAQGKIVMDGAPREVFTHASELRAIGLGVPAATDIALQLAEKGFPVDIHTITLEELTAQIGKALDRKGGPDA